MKQCPKCKVDKQLSEFNKNSKRKDGLQRICRICSRKEDNKSYLKSKETDPRIRYDKNDKVRKQRLDWVNEFKKEGCVKCGGQRYYVVDFHHIDESQKDFNISGGGYGYKKLKKEISKCIILCKNCHAEFHHMERNSNISTDDYINRACSQVGEGT